MKNEINKAPAVLTLDEIKAVCSKLHGDQEYGPKHTYAYHLAATEAVARRFGFKDPDILIACWAHDVIEDTQTSAEDLLAMGFPERAVRIVVAVTDEPGATRKERKILTYPKIRGFKEAMVVKLCDRIANVEASLAWKDQSARSKRIYEMYVGEKVEFEVALRDPSDGLENMWSHLNGLFV